MNIDIGNFYKTITTGSNDATVYGMGDAPLTKTDEAKQKLFGVKPLANREVKVLDGDVQKGNEIRESLLQSLSEKYAKGDTDFVARLRVELFGKDGAKQGTSIKGLEARRIIDFARTHATNVTAQIDKALNAIPNLNADVRAALVKTIQDQAHHPDVVAFLDKYESGNRDIASLQRVCALAHQLGVAGRDTFADGYLVGFAGDEKAAEANETTKTQFERATTEFDRGVNTGANDLQKQKVLDAKPQTTTAGKTTNASGTETKIGTDKKTTKTTATNAKVENEAIANKKKQYLGGFSGFADRMLDDTPATDLKALKERTEKLLERFGITKDDLRACKNDFIAQFSKGIADEALDATLEYTTSPETKTNHPNLNEGNLVNSALMRKFVEFTAGLKSSGSVDSEMFSTLISKTKTFDKFTGTTQLIKSSAESPKIFKQSQNCCAIMSFVNAYNLDATTAGNVRKVFSETQDSYTFKELDNKGNVSSKGGITIPKAEVDKLPDTYSTFERAVYLALTKLDPERYGMDGNKIKLGDMLDIVDVGRIFGQNVHNRKVDSATSDVQKRQVWTDAMGSFAQHNACVMRFGNEGGGHYMAVCGTYHNEDSGDYGYILADSVEHAGDTDKPEANPQLIKFSAVTNKFNDGSGCDTYQLHVFTDPSNPEPQSWEMR